MSDWFMLRPAISLSGVQVSNPQGFSRQSLLQADRVSLQIGLLPLLQNEVHVRDIVFEEPHVRVERTAEGQSNVAMLLAGLAAGAESAAEQPDGRRWSVDSFALKSGSVSFMGDEVLQPALTILGINLNLRNLGPGRQAELQLQAHLFGDPASHLRLDGRAGPFTPDSAPAEGQLIIRVMPGKIPISVREEYFGQMLRAPGSSGVAVIRADMQGDLAQVFRGEGRLSLEDVHLGKDARHQVPLRGEIPVTLTIRQLLAEPGFELSAPRAALQLGEGEWKGSFSASYSDNQISGQGQGSISDLDINELVSSVTTSEGAIFGQGSIPEYTIRFSGRDADQLAASLTGQGRLELSEGQVAFLDLLYAIQREVERFRSGEAQAEGETPFSSLQSNFQVRDRRVILSDIILESSSLQVTGDGFFTFDQDLQFDLTAHLQGDTAAFIPGQQGRSVPIPISVRGTVDEPKVSPDLGSLLRRRGTDFLESLFR